MPWKNGGGETREVAVHPADAGLADFDWRVSLATMTADGPFSAFPGIDRTLAVIAGEGIALMVGRHALLRLTAASDPFGFAADTACMARLLSGPVTNLNVMTRRSRFRHLVSRIDLRGPAKVAAQATTLLVCCGGSMAVEGHVIERHDVLLCGEPHSLSLTPCGGPATAMLITVLRETARSAG